MEDIGLGDPVTLPDREVDGIGIDRVAEVDGGDGGALSEQYLGKSAGATACFENLRARQMVENLGAETVPDPVAADREAGVGVQLRLGEAVPLVAKAGDIVLAGDEPGNTAKDGESTAGGTGQSAFGRGQRLAGFGVGPGDRKAHWGNWRRAGRRPGIGLVAN